MRLKLIILSMLVTPFSLSLFTPVCGGMRDLSFQAKIGFVASTQDNMHSRLTTGLGIMLPLKNHVSVSLDLGFWKNSVDEEPHKFYEGKITLIPILASLRYSLLSDQTIHPYIFIGVGYVFAHFKMEDIITIPEITISQSVKNGFSWHTGAGTAIRISESLEIHAEALYFNRKTTGITTISDLNFGLTSEKFPVGLHAFIFRVGIEYVFN